MKLIDKDKVISEIETQGAIQPQLSWFTDKLVQIINSSVEVKEVDLDSNIRTYLTNHFNIYEDGVLQSKKSRLPLKTYDIIKVAEHFFKLGLNAKKGE